MKGITIIFIILSFASYGQTDTLISDVKYFTLGIIGDYEGLRYVEGKDDSIVTRVVEDKYYKLNIVDSLFKISKNRNNLNIDNKIVRFGISKGYDRPTFVLFSSDLGSFIRSFYKFEESYASKHSNNGFKEYTGKLLFVKLKKSTEEQIISFLAGAYLFYGHIDEKEKDKYTILMPNSLSKMAIINKLLKKFGCKKVKYKIYKYLPNAHLITFIPSTKLKMVFDYINEIQLNLNHK